jgi:predicted DNA-binding protein YlxM (UPF0122 family)
LSRLSFPDIKLSSVYGILKQTGGKKMNKKRQYHSEYTLEEIAKELGITRERVR